MHYQRWRKSDLYSVPEASRGCSIEGCNKKHSARGWCSTHYKRWQKHGSPDGFSARMTHEDECIVDGCERKYYTMGACAKHYPVFRQKGITAADYNEMMTRQDGRCAICEDLFVETPHIDHDHSCCKGQSSCGNCVRSLLCRHCNAMVGFARENTETLIRGVEYLNRHKSVIEEVI